MLPRLVFSVLAAPVEVAAVAEPVADPVWPPLDKVVDALGVADACVLVEAEVMAEDELSAIDPLLVPLDELNALTSTGTTPGQALMHSCVGIQSASFSPLLPG